MSTQPRIIPPGEVLPPMQLTERPPRGNAEPAAPSSTAFKKSRRVVSAVCVRLSLVAERMDLACMPPPRDTSSTISPLDADRNQRGGAEQETADRERKSPWGATTLAADKGRRLRQVRPTFRAACFGVPQLDSGQVVTAFDAVGCITAALREQRSQR